MALTPRKHGVTHNVAAISQLPLAVVASSIWGMVAIASDAEADVFPLNTAVLVTDARAAIDAAGEQGTLITCLQALATIGRSIGVIVRVADGVGETEPEKQADLDAKVIAGLQKLRVASQTLQVKPRIIAAPGLDNLNVTKAMETLLPQLSGFGYAAAEGDTPQEVATYRANFTGKELMLIDRDFVAFDDVNKVEVTSFAPAHAVALRVLLDRDQGYHKTISNVPVPGVIGVVEPRVFDPNSADTEMGLINGADVTGLIHYKGHRFWGQRTCSADPRFVFESAVRSHQFVRDMILDGLFPYIDQPLLGSLATDIVESLNKAGAVEVRAGRLIGIEFFLSDGNTAAQLNAGKLKIGYRVTFVAPLEDLDVTAEVTDVFYADVFNLAA